jgi:hypothetical protein
MTKYLIIILLLVSITSLANDNTSAITTNSKAASAKNLIIVTIDGLRWQEVFTGADNNLLHNDKFVRESSHTKQKFWHDNKEKRRQLLMPFFWDTIVKNGLVIGNRKLGSEMSVSNNWHFSYPGYSEIFTGIADPKINSNKKVPNPHISFIEWLNNQPSFGNKLAVFGS